MFKSFLTSYQIMFSQKVNMWIYYLKKIPYLGKFIPNSLYNTSSLKRFLSTIAYIFSFLFSFIKKLIYIFFMIVFPAFFISEHNSMDSNIIQFHILFFLSFVSAPFLGNIFTKDSKKDYIMIKLIRFDPKNYYLGLILYDSVTNFLTLLLPLMVLKCSFFESIIISLEFVLIRVILQSFHLLIGNTKGEQLSSQWYYLLFLVFIPFICAYALPFMKIAFNSKTLLLSIAFFIVIFILGIISIVHLLKSTKYTLLSKYILSKNNSDNLFDDDISDAVFTDVKIDDKSFNSYDLKHDKYKDKQGIDYLNYKFIERHKKIIITPIKRTTCIIAAIFAVFILLVFIFPKYNDEISESILLYNGTLVFFLYLMSSGEKITRAFFFNCDNSLLRHKFYTTKQNILSNFKCRLKLTVLLNLLPAFTLALGLLIVFLLVNGSLLRFIPIFISIITLSIFFAVHYLFLYYITQPYTSQLTIKSPIYKFASFVVYFVSYSCTKIHTPSILFTFLIIFITVIYTVVALCAVYKYAYKTFKLK